jgi:hypothetical protein
LAKLRALFLASVGACRRLKTEAPAVFARIVIELLVKMLKWAMAVVALMLHKLSANPVTKDWTGS